MKKKWRVRDNLVVGQNYDGEEFVAEMAQFKNKEVLIDIIKIDGKKRVKDLVEASEHLFNEWKKSQKDKKKVSTNEIKGIISKAETIPGTKIKVVTGISLSDANVVAGKIIEGKDFVVHIFDGKKLVSMASENVDIDLREIAPEIGKILGGSGGAKSINNAVIDKLDLIKNNDIQLAAEPASTVGMSDIDIDYTAKKNKIINTLKNKGGADRNLWDIQHLEAILHLYVKEAPTKLTFIGEYEEPILETGYFKTVRAENRVKFKIEIYPNECKLILFGGSEPLMSKTLFSINSTFRKFIDGNHKTFSPYLSREDMFKVLSSFGFDVEYIYIDPGESKKLRKYVEKKRGKELKIEMVYDVHTQYRGYRITASPVVQQMIKESGIQIREIQAKISYGVTRITVRVNSSGRLVFFIPGNLPSDEDELYEIASEIYRQIMDEKLKTTPPLTLDSYIGEIE